MKFPLPWRKPVSYDSRLWFLSDQFPGVEFGVSKISLAQRIELFARIRGLTLKHEFLKAGELADRLEADAADLLVKRLYLEWAVTEIRGIKIDGKPASVALLIQFGPEELANEIFDAIKNGLHLSDVERKNF